MKLDYFRNFIFGAEDSLVSTVGVLFGIATAHYDKKSIILTGLVVIAVEALSMGAGSFLSEQSTHELDGGDKHKSNPVIDGVIMFLSYFFAGFIPLAPYIFIGTESAKYVSVLFAILGLFVLGIIPGKNLRGGLRMAAVGGSAVFIGFAIAEIFNVYAV